MPKLKNIIGLLNAALLFSTAVNADEAAPLGEYRILALCLQNDTEIIAGKAVSLDFTPDWEGFAERDLLLVEIRKNIIHTLVGKTTVQTDEDLVAKWKRTEHVGFTDRLRATANCQHEWDWVLIGKDTTVKKRWRNFVSDEDLYETIDAMPIRQREMQLQKRDR